MNPKQPTFPISQICWIQLANGLEVWEKINQDLVHESSTSKLPVITNLGTSLPN